MGVEGGGSSIRVSSFAGCIAEEKHVRVARRRISDYLKKKDLIEERIDVTNELKQIKEPVEAV